VRDRPYRIAYYGLTLLFGAPSLIVLFNASDKMHTLAQFLPVANICGRQPAISRGALDRSGGAR